MQNYFLLLCFLLTTSLSLFGQTNKVFFVGIGAQTTSFQDVKYSDVRYGGIGGVMQIGVTRQNDRALSGLQLEINMSNEAAATNDNATAFTVNPAVRFNYSKAINDNLYIGGRWDILDFYFRNTNGLGNNSTYYIVSSNLFAAAEYRLNKWHFCLDLGLLSYVKESTGFAFSSPQNALEDGEFDYQNKALDDPFAFKYYELQSVFNHLNLRTQVRYQMTDRLSLGYFWNARKFANVANYPVTYGRNVIVLRYHFSQKQQP